MFLLLCRQYLRVDSQTRGSKSLLLRRIHDENVSLLVGKGFRCEPVMLIGKDRLVVVAYTSIDTQQKEYQLVFSSFSKKGTQLLFLHLLAMGRYNCFENYVA